MRILIVEDEDFSRAVLQQYIEQLGHTVTAATNGREAWDLLQQEEFPFVISDWLMPEMDGLELVRMIRASSRSGYVYIILLTAKADKRDVVQGIMEGADDFLTKPYDKDELKVRVRAGERVLELESRLYARNAELAAASRKLEEANVELSRMNHQMKRNLEAAARIQRSFLPTTIPETGVVDAAWIFRPCEELAGDTFNIFQLDDEHIGFYLLDVVGKGVSAALLAVTLNRFLSLSGILLSTRTLGGRAMSPRELAEELNNRFPMNENTGQFFTLLFGTINIKRRELRFVSAGHPGLLYAPRGDRPQLVETSGFPIGITTDPSYEEISLMLKAGDNVVLYSDGLLDAENSQGEPFGTKGLMECVNNDCRSIQEMVDSIEKRIVSWCQGHPIDDISVLALRLLDGN